MLSDFLYCAIVRISLAISSGLVMCASMPASRLFCMSSAKALAVIAAIGRIAVSDLPIWRICRVASWPSMTGIITSMSTRSKVPGG